MKHPYRLLVTAAAAACALLAVAPAQAAAKEAPVDAQLSLATVSGGALGSRAVVSAPSESLVGDSASLAVDSGSLQAAAAACWWAQAWRRGSNIFGMTLWTYYQRIEWCASGGKITSVTRIRWGEVSMPGWSFKGHTSSTTSGGKGSYSYRARTHGHFCLVQYFSCIQNAYPWIDMTVRANGTWSWSAGG